MGKKITFTEALLTAIGMVIGSGIFFRADNILEFTDGNLVVAIVGWVALGATLIFAGIGTSVLAARSTKEGGIVGYMEECYGKVASFLTGWFTTMIYIPLLVGVLSIVASGYLLALFGVAETVMAKQVLAACLIVIVYLWNMFSTKFSALFSSAATVIKLFPIVIIGLVGMVNFDGALISEGASTFSMGALTAPLLSMAFAFDGWTTVATLSRDMENPRKDIAKVLALNAVIVTIAYTLYFTGMTMLGSKAFGGDIAALIAAGDNHVGFVANHFFGDIGEKLILFCVVMSVMGTLNGNIMGAYRYPHALAQAGDLPKSEFFAKTSKWGTTANSSFVSVIAIVVWFALYTIQAFAASGVAEGQSYMFDSITFDDIPIMAMAIVIIFLLIAAMRYGYKEGAGIFKSIIAPIIGMVGQVYIVVSFASTNEAWLLYIGVCIVILIVGFLIRAAVKSGQKA